MTYIYLNLALVLVYCVSRGLLMIPTFKTMRHSHTLRLTRFILVSVILAWMLMPIISKHIPTEYRSTFELVPIVKQNIVITTDQAPTYIASPVKKIHWNSLSLLILLWGLGCGYFLLSYLKSLHRLNQLVRNAYCQHKIKNVSILFSEQFNIPFCWSLANKYFIAMPIHLTNKDKMLALRHELQHIRQGDTAWPHFYALLKAICFLNLFVWLWIDWQRDLQEFACDESVVTKQKNTLHDYAQCLINTAKNHTEQSGLQAVVGIHGFSKSILYRRVNMLLNYSQGRSTISTAIAGFALSFLIASGLAYAVNGNKTTKLTTQEVTALIKKADLDKTFDVTATPEVVAELNNILGSEKARATLSEGMQRIKQYPYIPNAIKANHLPENILVVPLIESYYQPLEEKVNPVKAAGIWQIIPATATRYGLAVDKNNDERMNTERSTDAMLHYLSDNHKQFNNWRLAVLAYEFGELNIGEMIRATGTQNTWEMAKAPNTPKTYKEFQARLDAELIILNNPTLLN